MGLRGRTAAVAAVLLVTAGAGAGSEAQGAQRGVFDYDRSKPIDLRDNGRANGAYSIAIRNVSFAVPGGRVQAYLVLPPGKDRVPGAVYLHGSGGDRSQLLLPAAWLAARRAVTLAITLPSTAAGAQPSGLTPAQALARQRRISVADVVAARRAVDVLRSLPRVDPQRIGLVGWSLGAKVGAVLAGAEPRIRVFALVSGGATPVSAYVAKAPPKLRPLTRRTLTAIDPLRWIARGRPGTILLQDGRRDTIVPRNALLALAHAAPPRTELRWYPGGHGLTIAAYREQLTWLSRKLAIRGPAVRGARTGP
jgi:dienelactone hydrolase